MAGPAGWGRHEPRGDGTVFLAGGKSERHGDEAGTTSKRLALQL